MLAALKIALGVSFVAGGFFAFSDDDFSRVVIAQRFAAHASLDPSGTSWLPLPFWMTGSAMAVFGRSLGVARGVALVSGVLSVLLVHRAASWLGASRPAAFAGAALAGGIPTAARLGVSFQPEALTAGLVVIGAAATSVAGSRRTLGAAALAAASLSRYEAWPAALIFAGLSARDALVARRSGPARTPSHFPDRTAPAPAFAAVVALAAPVLWILHGAVTHDDAFFFVHRVVAYRRALGVGESLAASLAAYPLALLREPELMLATAASLTVALHAERRLPSSYARPALVIGGVVAFLVAGRLADGAPTHHTERTLLSVWSFVAIAGASMALHTPAKRSLPLIFGAAAMGAALRVTATPEPFAPRERERAIGEAARRLVPPGERIVIDTADYGYFAVMAAFGAPERADPLDVHDPREPHVRDVFDSPAHLRKAVLVRGAQWLVARDDHEAVASQIGEMVQRAGGFTLVRVAR